MIKPAQRGVSLIEALVSLLVISIGLLGLAQLQARLSIASLRLHASSQAYLLGATGIERSLTLWASNTGGLGAASNILDTPATRFETANNLALANRLIYADVRVRWTDASGPGEIRLNTMANSSPGVVDIYLLLSTY